MSAPRIYQAMPLLLQTNIVLDEKASHHLSRVLRMKTSDSVIIFNGQGGEFEANIKAIDKKNVTVELTAFHADNRESPFQLFLAQGIARGEKMDFIVQKAVELGVTKIFPLITERISVRLNQEQAAKRLAHWQSVAISACEQCGRNLLPEIASPQTFENCVNFPAGERFILDPHDAGVSFSRLAMNKNNSTCLLFIGPEGGFSANEMQLARSQGVLPLNLGPRILRTETATIAGLTLFQGFFGDMQQGLTEEHL